MEKKKNVTLFLERLISFTHYPAQRAIVYELQNKHKKSRPFKTGGSFYY